MKKIILTILLLIFAPFVTNAAVLYFDPAEEYYGPGDEFAVSLKLDVNTSCINTVEAEIEFPREQLLLKDFIVGESIINVWVENPSLADMPEANKNGKLHISGGIPGGYCGKIPGDPGDSNLLGRLIFQLPKFSVGTKPEGELEISFGNRTRVFQNDGLGTEDIIATRTAKIIIQDKAVNPTLDWDYLINRDKTPPEPFVIEVHQSDRVFEGKYYLIFNTVDKQSGIDHYEVLEIKPGEEIGKTQDQKWWERLFLEEKTAPNWVRAKMPYVLSDQSLGSIIRVQAIDRAGNVRMVEYIPPYIEEIKDEKISLPIIITIGIVIILVLVLIIFILHKIFNKFKNKPHVEDNNN
jgi:hypothetical protein